ncbi:MAG: ABC transporter permease subunit/CPBP intramembrane protease [Deltaproteobacteria bacterium]
MPDLPPAHANDRLFRLGRLTLKELREILRDRRTIVTLVLMPLFMYPLMSVAFQQFFISQLGTTGTPTYTIGFQDPETANFLRYLLAEGGLEVLDFDQPAEPPAAGSPPVVRAGISPRLQELLEDYKIDVGLRLMTPRPGLRVDPRRDLAVDMELLYLPGSGASRDAAAYVEKHLAIANQKLLSARLRQLAVTQRPVPVQSVRRAVEESETAAGTGAISLRSVVPFILILMTVTGAVYPAIDLTAGERERGTLEVLMAAPIPRLGILLAKYVTVLAVALLTAAANLVTMTITIAVSGLGPVLFGESGFPAGAMAAVFGLLLLFAAFFSAVLLVVTSTARSFKEAQAYLIPLMLVSLAPGMLSLMPDVKLAGVLLVTPLANIVLLGRDLLEFKATGPATLIVVASTLLYAAAAIGMAARIFGAESVLYSSQSGWSDLLRRPRAAQSAPTVTSALVCLALVFPAWFLFFNLMPFLNSDVFTQLALGALMTAIVFGGIPLAACRLRRVPVGPAFRLPASPLPVFIAAALVGLSLWILCQEIVVLLNWHDLTLNPRLVEKLKEYVERLRSVPMPVVLLVMAVTPAFFEEAFFRGFLFAALRPRTSPAMAIVATAVAFGFFHWISPSLMASERFVSSTLVGLVLGWVRWQTGTLLTGILLHTLHNGFLVLLAYYEPQLAALGIGLAEDKHLPTAWIVAGACAVAGGLVLLYVATRRGDDREEASPARSV